MRYGTLTEELDSITKDYDYGIVPGSAAVFVKDEILGIGRLDLTLLEGVMVVIEVSTQGYKIASSLPLAHDPKTVESAEYVQSCVETGPYETMESLLMTISPLFKERFQATLYDKLHKVQQEQQLLHQQHILNPTSSSINSPDQLHNLIDDHHHSTLLSSTNDISHHSIDLDKNNNNNNKNSMNHSIQLQHFNHNNNNNSIPPSTNSSDMLDDINQWIN